MRRFVLTLHLIVALMAGAFLVVFGVTGSIMAFEPELDHLLHARVSYVEPRGAPKPLSELAAAAASAIGAQRASGYLMPSSPDLSYQIVFGRRGVFVNQYTGEVLGIREAGPDLLSRVHQLHLRLLIQNRSDTGKTIMAWAGLALLLLLGSGLYLWWPVKRVTIGSRKSGWRWWFDVHNATGIFSFVFLLAVGITGVAIGFEDRIVPMIYKATGSEPLLMYAPPKKFQSARGGAPIGVDRAVEIARATLPGATPISVNVPPPTGVYTVSARFPEDRTPGGRSRIVIDQFTGAVLAVESSRTAPAGSRLVTLNRAIHTGDVFGIPSKAIMSVASLAVVVQFVTGLFMWRTRR